MRIYPQRSGVPIFNRSGRYWVKLFFMGQERKVEIDDRMPCNAYQEYLFPKCTQIEELWPGILTKAILKLMSFKLLSSRFNEVGDISILAALTGNIPESTSLGDLECKPFNLDGIYSLYNMVSEDYFERGSKRIFCYHPKLNTRTKQFKRNASLNPSNALGSASLDIFKNSNSKSQKKKTTSK